MESVNLIEKLIEGILLWSTLFNGINSALNICIAYEEYRCTTISNMKLRGRCRKSLEYSIWYISSAIVSFCGFATYKCDIDIIELFH